MQFRKAGLALAPVCTAGWVGIMAEATSATRVELVISDTSWVLSNKPSEEENEAGSGCTALVKYIKVEARENRSNSKIQFITRDKLSFIIILLWLSLLPWLQPANTCQVQLSCRAFACADWPFKLMLYLELPSEDCSSTSNVLFSISWHVLQVGDIARPIKYMIMYISDLSRWLAGYIIFRQH